MMRRTILLCVALSMANAALAGDRVLRVCADPNNLPFSNQAGEGFENKLAQWMAQDLGARVETTWWAQRRGFLKNTLAAGKCDLVLGAPAGDSRILSTHPYYRSTFVLLSRAGRGLHIDSLDDPRLRRLKIGIHVAGQTQLSPPAIALAQRGIVANVVGYPIYGDYATPNPPLALVDAVARGNVDAAIIWGPFGGFGALISTQRLAIQRLPGDVGSPPFSYAMAISVRRGDKALAQQLDRALARRRPQIRELLAAYGIPELPLDAPEEVK